MFLSELLKDIKYSGNLPEDREITHITSDSRAVCEGCLFVCIKGLRFDGHDAAAKAVENGAAAVVAERDVGVENQIIVENSRSAYAIICGNYYGRPAERLKLIGVTGTNGKTTITILIKNMLEYAGKRVGLIGTIKNEIEDMSLPAKYTTPDPLELHLLFKKMADAGCEYVVMETSSHALDQHRLDGCKFECGIFTNLTQDHLDYHLTMENYYLAKRKLFDITKRAVINIDDEYGRRLCGEVKCPFKTFSTSRTEADYTAHNIGFDMRGSSFELAGYGEIGRVKFRMPGEFAVSDAMAAGVCALSLGVDFDTMIAGLNHSPGVPGRAEILKTDTDFTVIRDYAHSADSLEKILTTVKSFAPGRVVVLFGCAGNRDRTKRPKMAKAASKLADFVILTSDNPRSEDEMQIINDALPGLDPKKPHKVIPNRYEAIKWALENSRKNDILVLAGKGHEDYQVLSYGTIYFDESEIVQELLEKMRK